MIRPLIFLLFASTALAQPLGLSDEASREIQRRGYLPQLVSEDYGDESTVSEAFALPKSDKDKFTLTVVYGAWQNSQLNALKHDMLTAKELEPWFVCKDRAKGTYDLYSLPDSHIKVVWQQHKGPFRPGQFDGVKIDGYPCLILQPAHSGKFGPPEIVVAQTTGYKSPEELAKWLRDSMKRYCNSDLCKLAVQKHEGYAGHEQERSGFEPPFQVRPKVLPQGPNPLTPLPPDYPPVEDSLTLEQIQAAAPDATPEFYVEQYAKKPKTASEVQVAWLMKKLEEKPKEPEVKIVEVPKIIEKIVEKVKEVEVPAEIPAGSMVIPWWITVAVPAILASPYFWMAIQALLKRLKERAAATPSKLDDRRVDILIALAEKLEKANLK